MPQAKTKPRRPFGGMTIDMDHIKRLVDYYQKRADAATTYWEYLLTWKQAADAIERQTKGLREAVDNDLTAISNNEIRTAMEKTR